MTVGRQTQWSAVPSAWGDSVPDVVFDPAKQIMDFKLTPKAVRPAQSVNFTKDFPGNDVDYIFGPGPWR